jgi:hypothetical protein
MRIEERIGNDQAWEHSGGMGLVIAFYASAGFVLYKQKAIRREIGLETNG